ncbi:MAG: PIG-L family deacetylase [Verrucomicrobiales bacterium]|nr:PIG-L family deacetylase [Verrucomicrobiales bacterium]
MNPFHNSLADTFISDGTSAQEALARTTHLAIGAHSDDLEIMAYHGIVGCYGYRKTDKWFSGITVTDGRGSSRSGPYSDCTDEEMADIRKNEQRQAAMVGKYGAMIQLAYESDQIMQDDGQNHLRDDLSSVFDFCQPEIVYTHNPADKHDTHIAVLSAAIHVMRELPSEKRPKRILGCEVWRDLDWMPDEDKVALDVSKRENLANALVGIFDSQITGGKRYDRAAVGRRYANATFFHAGGQDRIEQLTFAMDLTPLVEYSEMDVKDYVLSYIEKFRCEVESNLDRFF